MALTLFCGPLAHAQDLTAKITPLTVKEDVKGDLEDRQIYAIDIACTKKAPLRRVFIPGWLKDTTFTTSEFLFIGPEVPISAPDGKSPLPTSALAVVPVFVVDGEKKSAFDRRDCRHSFFISGGQELYVFATINYSVKYSASRFSKILNAGLSLIQPLYSLLNPVSLPATIVSKITNVQATQGPISQILEAMNDGWNFPVARRLSPGKYIFGTPFVDVTVSVRPVESVVLDTTTTFRRDFRTQVYQTAEKLEVKPDSCSQVAGRLGQLGFKSVDQAYATYILATRAGFDRSDLIRCLGRKFAFTAIDYQHLFFWPDDRDQFKFTREEVNNVIPPPDPLVESQPSYKAVAATLNDLVDYLAKFTRNESVDAGTQQVLERVLAKDIIINDRTEAGLIGINADPHDRFEALAKVRGSGFIRMGCLYQTLNELEPEIDGAPGVFLAFKASNNDSQVPFANALVVRPQFENGLVSRLSVWENGSWEQFILEKHKYRCKSLLVDKAPGPPAADASASK
jgi:hypothetical protein